MVVSRREGLGAFLVLFSFHKRGTDVILLRSCRGILMYVHYVLACLLSIFLAGASLCNGDVRDESDRAGTRFGFSEQMSQVASTGRVGLGFRSGASQSFRTQRQASWTRLSGAQPCGPWICPLKRFPVKQDTKRKGYQSRGSNVPCFCLPFPSTARLAYATLKDKGKGLPLWLNPGTIV
jgi:hypothetical protein